MSTIKKPVSQDNTLQVNGENPYSFRKKDPNVVLTKSSTTYLGVQKTEPIVRTTILKTNDNSKSKSPKIDEPQYNKGRVSFVDNNNTQSYNTTSPPRETVNGNSHVSPRVGTMFEERKDLFFSPIADLRKTNGTTLYPQLDGKKIEQ